MKDLSVVVIDDSVLIRDLLECALSKVEGCNLIGMAVDGVEGISMIRDLQPQMVILDVSMPNKDGIEVLREVRQENSQTTIIMFTSDASMALKDFCLEAGADYCLVKTQLQELLDTCREVVATRNSKQLVRGRAGLENRFSNYS